MYFLMRPRPKTVLQSSDQQWSHKKKSLLTILYDMKYQILYMNPKIVLLLGNHNRVQIIMGPRLRIPKGSTRLFYTVNKLFADKVPAAIILLSL